MEVTEQSRLSQAAIQTPGVWPRPYIGSLQEMVLDRLLPLTASVFLFAAVLVLIALNEHALIDVRPSASTEIVRAVVPFLAAAVATWAVHRPWPAFVAVAALTPVWNSALFQIDIGPVQIILQTVFVAALTVGCLVAGRSRHSLGRSSGGDTAGALPAPVTLVPRTALAARIGALPGRYHSYRLAQVAVTGFAAMAVLSTLVSINVPASATVLMHGIAEPIAMGAILLWLRPSRRQLVALGIGLGAAMALTSLISIAQMLPDYRTLAAVQAHRLIFSRVAFSNVGQFGITVAMIVPTIIGLLWLKGTLTLSRAASAALALLLVLALAGLFFSFSKSAWLATSAGAALIVLMLVPTWRRRSAALIAAGLVSAAFIPWPALVLQPVPAANNAYRTAMVSLIGEARFDSWNPTTLAGKGSLAERFYAADAGIHMALDHPVLGVGLYQFRAYYITLGYRPHPAEDAVDHAHSLFPEVAAELGIPAATLLAVAMGAAMWAMLRAYRRSADGLTRILAASLFASLAAWTIAATAFGVDIYRWFRYMASDVMLFAIVMAMAIALSRLASSEGVARIRTTR